MSGERLVLHGSAVCLGRSAVIFTGVSGAGKSTVAASLSTYHPVLCDEYAIVELGEVAKVIPEAGQLRLPSESAVRLGLTGKVGRDGKLEVTCRRETDPVEVLAVVEIVRGGEDGLTGLTGAERVKVLLGASFGSCGEPETAERERLGLCGRLSMLVRVERLMLRDGGVEGLARRVELALGEGGAAQT